MDEYVRKNITQPPDWWEAYQEAARKANLSLSEWLGERANTGLPAGVRRKLSARRRRGPQPNGRAARRKKG